jgi:Ca-activated chloride channel family protein
MFKFEHDIYLYALLIIPIMVIVYIWRLHQRKKRLLKFADYELVKELTSTASSQKKNTKFILNLFALFFLILGIANLQTGSKLKEVKREGSDIMVCLDVSNSMLAQDLTPNRLERAKIAIEKMINELQGDRLGIIVFAGQAYVQLPITTDYSAAKLFLESINTKIVPTQGTNIADAINLAVESFGKDEGKNKAIVIITDGENNEDESVVKSAEEASKNNIVIHTIGVGSEKGVPIPHYVNDAAAGYKKDKDGNTVVTKLDSKTLEDIAGAAGGVYVHAANSDMGLGTILDKIAELDKTQMESKQFTDYEDQFQWFIGAALIFLVIEFMFTERVSEFWKKINLFNESKK